MFHTKGLITFIEINGSRQPLTSVGSGGNIVTSTHTHTSLCVENKSRGQRTGLRKMQRMGIRKRKTGEKTTSGRKGKRVKDG